MKFKNQHHIDTFNRRYIEAGGNPMHLTTNAEYTEYLSKASVSVLLDELKHGLLPELCEIELQKRGVQYEMATSSHQPKG